MFSPRYINVSQFIVCSASVIIDNYDVFAFKSFIELKHWSHFAEQTINWQKAKETSTELQSNTLKVLHKSC